MVGYQSASWFRCIALYGSIFMAEALFGLARDRGIFAAVRRPLPWQLFLLTLLPIGADGISHMLGLRENNAWFDALSGGAFTGFSVGDGVGTLNWWLRVVSGSLMGFCAGWLVFPWVQRAVDEARRPYGPAGAMPPTAPGSAN